MIARLHRRPATLRIAAAGLRARGVRGLWVDGSVARGSARPGTAVELLCLFEADARVSLVGLSSLRAELSALLGAPVVLVERSSDGPDGGAVRAL